MKQLLVFLFITCNTLLLAQPGNDDCIGAINIPSVEDYCSDNMEFTNVGATTFHGGIYDQSFYNFKTVTA